MRDLYGWSGLRYQAGTWALLAGGFSAAALASGAAMATGGVAVTSTSFVLLLVAAWLGHALLLGGVAALVEAQTGTMFRLGLGYVLPRFRALMYPALAVAALAPVVPLVLLRIDVYSLALLLAAQLLLALLCGDTAYLHWRALRRAIEQSPAADRRLDELAARHGAPAMERLRLSTDLMRGKAPHANPTNMQRQRVIVGLTARPWMERPEFPWSTALEHGWLSVRDEYRDYLRSGRTLRDYDYPGAVDGKWNTVMLVAASQPTPEAANFPQTMALLEQIPRFPRLREAQISVLGPGSRIKPHRDSGNEWITCQLALIVPDAARCGIRVGGLARTWEEGRCIFFNTSFEHEAWNDCDLPRVVLIADFLHPEISDAEADFWTPPAAAKVPESAPTPLITATATD